MHSARNAAATRPLDALSVAPAGWYDVARRDFASYTGALCRIQRTSDNAELDIGYASDGWLDIAAIAAHCAGTTGRVKTLYDQSGNGRSLTNATHAQQPIIYAAAAQIVMGTKPAMDFDGAGTYLTRADACGLTGATAYTMGFIGDGDAVGRVSILAGRNSHGTAGFNAYQYESGTAATIVGSASANTTFGSLPAGTNSAPHYSISQLAAGAQHGTATLRVNGVAATETAELFPTTVLSLLNERTILGALWNSGATSVYYDGRGAGGFIFGSVLSAPDLAIVEAACAGVIV